MKHKSVIKFDLQEKSTGKGRVVLYYGNRKYGVGISDIKKSYLTGDYLNQRYSSDPSEVKRANALLQKKKAALDAMIDKALMNGVQDIPAYIRQQKRKVKAKLTISGIKSPSHAITNTSTVLEAYEAFLNVKLLKLSNRAAGSRERYISLKDRIAEYETIRGSTELEEVDYKWIHSLREFFAKPRKTRRQITRNGATFWTTKIKGMNNTTLNRVIKDIWGFLRWIEDKYRLKLDRDIFDDAILLEAKQVDENVIALEKRHIDALEQIQKSATLSRQQERAVDIFLFSCYTGMAYTDAVSLNMDEIQQDGITIDKRRGKTNRRFVVKMNRKAQDIFKKYHGDFRQKFSDNTNLNKTLKGVAKKLTPFHDKVLLANRTLENNNQHYNKILKRVPLYKVLSFHIGRKTFITNEFKNNVPQIKICAQAGLSITAKSIQHYAKKFDYITIS